jgi:hypothetical protein
MRLIFADRNFKSTTQPILFLIAIFPFVFVTSTICQEKILNNDTLKIKNSTLFEEPITLHSIDNLHLPVGFYSNFTTYPELEFLELSNKMTNQKQPSFQVLQSSLLKNFKQSMQWKENYDLGVFGKYLGTAMGAAAVGLAAFSISKYGKDYFGSKKRNKKK